MQAEHKTLAAWLSMQSGCIIAFQSTDSSRVVRCRSTARIRDLSAVTCGQSGCAGNELMNAEFAQLLYAAHEAHGRSYGH